MSHSHFLSFSSRNFCHASPCAAAHSCPVMLPPRFAFFAGGGLESSAPPASSTICEARSKGRGWAASCASPAQHNALRAGWGGTAPPRGRAMRDHGGRARRATASRSALAWRPASQRGSLGLDISAQRAPAARHLRPPALSSQGTREVARRKGSPRKEGLPGQPPTILSGRVWGTDHGALRPAP